ncbi:hypothetical protein MMC18_007930 [Xylographa bjoerkii]|nr:hypothetical protein [Xylographa bjoerkii]
MAPSGQRCSGVSSIVNLLLQLAILSVVSYAEAQSASGTPLPAPTRAASSATVVPSTALYTYIGCYNETTGDDAAGNVRALAGGNMTATSSMTVNYCLSYCGSSAYAGIEYGRECWCAPYINAESQKLPDTDCTDACEGDGTEICGDALSLMLPYSPPPAVPTVVFSTSSTPIYSADLLYLQRHHSLPLSQPLQTAMSSPPAPPPTLLLLPGAWHSPSYYAALISALSAIPIPTHALALPSITAPTPSSPFAADVAAIRGAVSRLVLDEHKAVIVVMHSYSGAPGTSALRGLARADRQRAGQPGGVVGLVYLVSYMLPEGASILPEGERGQLPMESADEFRVTTIATAIAISVFYGDLPPAEAAHWAAQLQPQAMGVFYSPLTYAAWRDVPSTVVICEADAAMPPAKVEGMVETARALGAAEIVVERMGGGHFPMLGRVGEVVEVLERAVKRVAGA